MKYSECNARQKKAYANILHAAHQIIGGWENTMLDYKPDTEEYKQAEAILKDHDGLVDMIYRAATTEVYGEGFCCFNSAAQSYLKDIRFCGKEWLMERVEARVKKLGY